MRLGIVTGKVVMNLMDKSLEGTRFLVVEPVTAENLAAKNGKGGGRELIAATHLNVGLGQMVAFVEGREGANPYYPGRAPIDAYAGVIVENIEYNGPTPTVG